MRISIFLCACLLSLPLAATELGDATPPTQQQLNGLLSGNTMNGKWDGRPFTQYFDPKGGTRYREGRGGVSRGTWRINAAGQYCSVWPPSPTEACYDVLVKGNNVLWKSGGKVHPSSVTPGDSF